MNFREQMVHSIVVESMKADLKVPRTPKQFVEDLHTTVKSACQIAELASLELRFARPVETELEEVKQFRCVHDETDTLTLRLEDDSVGFRASIAVESIFLDAPQLRRLAAYANAAADKLEADR